jgi:hypothetical protein
MPKSSLNSIRNWPLWWFSALEVAVQRGDFDAAAKAQRQLVRLGVRVDYGPIRRPGIAKAQRASGGVQ